MKGLGFSGREIFFDIGVGLVWVPFFCLFANAAAAAAALGDVLGGSEVYGVSPSVILGVFDLVSRLDLGDCGRAAAGFATKGIF